MSDDDDDPQPSLRSPVLLGVPDGPLTHLPDIADAAVSRIGGHPAFLPSQPPLDDSLCNACLSPMHLLLQIWCPFEDSPFDRALYVWGCERAICQKQEKKSIRAWRGLRFNHPYAAKLEKKLARKRERENATSPLPATSKPNPFSISASTPPPSLIPFALGTQVFGATPAPSAPAPTPTPTPDDDDDDQDSGEDSESSLAVALASTSLHDSVWNATPAYAPIYLSTVSEYLPPQPKQKHPANLQIAQDKSDPTWTNEVYEDSLKIDSVFGQFASRVAHENEQCLRYELHGTPLPFSRDQIFNQLFPLPTSEATTVSKAAFTVAPSAKRTYTPSSNVIPPCPVCKAPRVFEFQLMPNLINVLKTPEVDPTPTPKQTNEERRKVVEKALKSEDGMSWGTVMIFSCEKDCCFERDSLVPANECWTEEFVLVQWDDVERANNDP